MSGQPEGRASWVSCLPPGQHATGNAISEDEGVHQRTRNMRDDENDQSGLEQHVSIASARVDVERYDAGGGQRHEKDIDP